MMSDHEVEEISATVMDAKWNKAVQDLQAAKDTDRPTKREIYIWEAVREIKALPAGSGWDILHIYGKSTGRRKD